MMKKMISWLGAVGALVSSAYAASATVWTEEGEGTMAPAYWYTFKYGTGASIDTSTTAANVKVGDMTATESKTANGAGFGLTWKQNADYEDTPVSLSAYKGVCLTYKATAPFRIDFKQSTITDDNYYGAEMPATAGAKVFLAFADLKQGWKSKTTVNWNAGKQMGIQFSYKSNYVTATQNSNTLQIVSLILDDECVTFPPEVVAPYTTITEMELEEGDTLALDMSKMFTDPDGDALTYTVKVLGDAKVADTLYNKTGIVNIITKENPKDGASVTITATDPNKKSATYSFDLATTDRENPPVAVNDSYETKEETALKVTLKNNVLLNDYDPDGDTYTAALVTAPAHGTLTFDGEAGTFTYTPEKDFFGTDAFTYMLTEDPRADATYDVQSSGEATVTIKVTNVDDPIQVVVVDSALTLEDKAYQLGDTLELNEDFETAMVKIPMENLVFSDPDVDGADLEVKVKTSGIVTAEYGTIKTNHVVELSSIANANGVAKVTLFAVDGKDTAAVSFYVNVLPVADPPVTVADAYKMVQDSVNKVDAKKGLLANDKNPDGKTTLKAYLYENATEGKVTVAEDGSFTYEAGHYQGEDTFMYYIVNAEGDTSEPAEVTLTVEYKNLAPQILPGVADTVGKRLANLVEDFTTVVKFTKVEIQSWFEDDGGVANLTFTARSDDSLLVANYNQTALFIGRVMNACGDATVILVATDSVGASTELPIPAKIACTNDKPVPVKVQDTLYIGFADWSDTLNLYDFVKDPDGDSLTFTVTSNKLIESKFDWELKDYNLIISTKDSSYLDKGASVSFSVKASDSLTYATFNLVLVAKPDPKSSIKPAFAAAPKATWQNAILTSRGAVALFDMQGRVMWKAKLPVSEADVRNAAAQVQGRKILQVNKQTWTIK